MYRVDTARGTMYMYNQPTDLYRARCVHDIYVALIYAWNVPQVFLNREIHCKFILHSKVHKHTQHNMVAAAARTQPVAIATHQLRYVRITETTAVVHKSNHSYSEYYYCSCSTFATAYFDAAACYITNKAY